MTSGYLPPCEDVWSDYWDDMWSGCARMEKTEAPALHTRSLLVWSIDSDGEEVVKMLDGKLRRAPAQDVARWMRKRSTWTHQQA